MKKLIAGTRMILCCVIIALYLIIVGIPVLMYCRIVRNPRLAIYLTQVLGRIMLVVAGFRARWEGMEKLAPKQSYVYIANHRSFSDFVVMFPDLPGDLRFLVKNEVFKIPLVSFALRTMGMIPVNRSDPEAAARSIETAVSEITSGRSVILYPEGTRSRKEQILPFKKGAFVLAIKSQVPVVPVTLIGADQILKPDTIWLYPGTIDAIIHDPIETTGLTLDDREALMLRAQNIIESTYYQRTGVLKQ